MKHVFTSAGLLALGAASIYAYDPELTRQQTGRPWAVAATVRGFYDDNPTTSPDRFVETDRAGNVVLNPFTGTPRVGHPEGSFGVEVSPSVHLNLPLEQTFISLGYLYSLRWYDDRQYHTDQAHEFDGKLRHQFSPRHELGVSDSFVYTSEPTVADRGGIITAPTRTRGNVLHNNGSIEDNIGLSQKFALSLGYMNNWYDYDQEGPGSRSALLDRMEHLIRIDGRYQVNPSLVGLLGYSFGINDYTGDDAIAYDFRFPIPRPIKSDIRDSYMHRVYVGADYDITAKLRTSVRVGGEYWDYHNSGESSFNPYADASVSYVYLPGSSVEFGIRHSRNATDIVTPDRGGNVTLDAETTVLYAQVSHRITAKLTGTLLGQYQTSQFNDGVNDSEGEDLILVGINFDYRFTEHFSGEVGYNFDSLNSDIKDRGYDRNRVYIGLRASY